MQVSAAGGNLRVVHINASQNGKSQKGDAPLLEFVVHDGQGQYDKSQDGEPSIALPQNPCCQHKCMLVV